MSESSEEKSEQPTQKKLRDARKKGQIAQSKDTVSIFATIATFAYFYIGWDLLVEQFTYLFSAPNNAYAAPFDQVWPVALDAAINVGIAIVAPFLIVSIMVSVLANIIVNGGVLFATEPLTPSFDKINPAKGMKRLFTWKNVLELFKSVVKITLLALFAILVLYWGTSAIMYAPACGFDCVAALFGELLKPFMALVVVFFIAIAFLDYFLQQNLFKRDMKMTKTEVKREHKEQEGDPLIKGTRRQLAQQFLTQNTVTGAKNANFLFVDGDECAVGLRYVEGETPVPIVVAKGRGAQAEHVIEAAREAKPIVIDRPNIAHSLFSRAMLDEPIPGELSNDVATAMGAAMAAAGRGGGED